MGTDFFFDDFLKFIELEKKYSAHTVLAYKTDLEQFSAFIAESKKDCHTELTATDIRRWVAQLMSDGLDARSVNRKISSLKALFRFGMRRGFISKNPMQKVLSPKTSKRLPVYIEKSKLENLFTDLGETHIPFPLLRDRLVLELLYGTGIRLSEAIFLKEADVRLHEQVIKVLGKRNKERIIPLHRELVRLLREYLELKSQLKTEENYLLITDKGAKAYPKFIYSIVNRYLAGVSTLKKRSPHVLRHSYATHLLDNGAELNAIKELLGHSSLSATQVYTHSSIQRLKDVYKKAHPKS
jgi:integrase/recombinase XerC